MANEQCTNLTSCLYQKFFPSLHSPCFCEVGEHPVRRFLRIEIQLNLKCFIWLSWYVLTFTDNIYIYLYNNDNIYICIYVYIYIYIYICIYIYWYICISIYLWINVQIYTYIDIYRERYRYIHIRLLIVSYSFFKMF